MKTIRRLIACLLATGLLAGNAPAGEAIPVIDASKIDFNKSPDGNSGQANLGIDNASKDKSIKLLIGCASIVVGGLAGIYIGGLIGYSQPGKSKDPVINGMMIGGISGALIGLVGALAILNATSK